MLISSGFCSAQPIINYPAAAQTLTRGSSSGMLTVQVAFTGACNNIAARIALPASVTYIAGSVIKTAGTAGLTISDSIVTNLNAPVFAIRGVTGSGTLTFTITRQAGCGSATSGKDSIFITSDCGNTMDNVGSTNSYNILSPSLSMVTPATTNNATIGQTLNRTVAITNGGNGCLDTLWYYVVYTGSGVANTSPTNAITANSVSFIPTSANGDTLFYKIYGSTLFGGDNILCNGETVNIVENVRVLKCGATTAYGVGWGKTKASQCQVATGNSTINMASGVPGVVAVNASSSIISGTNMCNAAVMQVTITNSGSEAVTGAGTAFNLVQLFGIDNGENINVRAPLIIDNVQISNNAGGWVSLSGTGGSTGRADTVKFSQLTSDPDGAGGLTDADGDGQFDELPVGASITIRYNITYTCQTACAVSNHSGSPTAQALYQNQCGVSSIGTKITAPSAASFSSRTLISSTQSGPTDISGGETATMRINFSRDFAIAGSTFSCPTDQVVLRIALPSGYSISAGRYYPVSSATSTNTISVTTVASAIPGNPDTAVIVGKRTTGGNYANISFEADITLSCAGSVSSSGLPFTISYVCDNSCSCEEKWLCSTYVLNPHCNTICGTGGLTLRGSQFRRTTTGFSSPYSSTYVAASTLTAAQLRYAMPYDTIRGTFPGVLYPGTPTPSVFTNHYFELSYDRLGSADVLEGYAANLRVKNNTTNAISTAVITGPSSSTVVSGRHIILYNVSAAGLTINSNDSIWLEPLFAVTNNTSLAASPVQLSGLKTRYYSTTAAPGVQLTCDQWGGELYLAKPDLGRNDGTGGITNNGCANYTYNALLYYNGPATDINPVEVRPYILLDSIKVYVTSGDSMTNTYSLRSYGNVSDGYASGNSILQTMVPNTRSADGKVATFINTGGAWAKGDYVTGNGGAGFQFNVGLTTGCSSVSNGSVFVTFYYKRFGYAYNTSVMLTDSNRSSRAITNNIASIVLSNLTGTVQGVLPQHYWDVRITNSGSYQAPFLWMAFNRTNSNVSIDSVVYDGINYGTGTSYGTGKSWFQISNTGLATGANKQARVYLKYASCNADSIQMLAGWNCSKYPTNPDNYTCTAITQYLKVIPQPSQIQLTMSRLPGNNSSISLCNQDSVTVLVNSAQSANLIAPYVDIYNAVGSTIVTPFPVEYPLGSGNWANLTPTTFTGGYRINLSQHPAIGAGMPGIVANPGAAARQAKIKIAYNTSCSFVSGSQFDFLGFGNSPCGAIATGSGSDVRSGAISITGAPAATGMGLTLNIPDSSLTCGSITTFHFSTTPVVTPTQVGDSILYTLPIGLVYNGNFADSQNCSACGILSIPNTNGQSQVKIGLMPGIPAGSRIAFSFSVRVDGAGCGTTPVNAQAERIISGLFCNSVQCTSSKAVIGTGNSRTILIIKPNIVINSLNRSFNSNWYPGGTGIIAASFTNNGNLPASANTITIEFFCDGATTPFAAKVISKAMAINATVNDTFTVNIPLSGCSKGTIISGKIRNLTAASQSQCICSDQSFSIAGIPLPLELLSFTASLNTSGSVGLAWTLSNESKYTSYEVMRSTNSIDFEAVGSLAATGNTTGARFTMSDHDLPPGNIVYYRLTLHQKDDNTSFSNMVPVMLRNDDDQVLIIPNPARDNIQVVLPSGWQQRQVSVTFYNYLGQQVANWKLPQAESVLQLPVAGLPAGIYSIKVLDAISRKIVTQKLTILR